MSAVEGVAGSQDGRRCSGQRTDARTDVALGEDVGHDDRFPLRVMATRYGSTQVYQVAAMGCHAIEAVAVWVARFADEAGSMLGTAALRRHWRSQDGMRSGGVVVE
jgi:hypothetical protein